MLDFIRERSHGWLVWLIVIAIIVPFALWGVHQYLGGRADTSVAKVNGVEISQARLQQAYMRQRERLQKMFGKNFRPELFPEARMKQQLLDDLIRNQLTLQAAYAADMRIGNAELAQAIGGIDAFQKDGKFSDARYRQLIGRQGMTPRQFEHNLRNDLLTQQYYIGLAKSGFVTDAQLNAYLKLQHQKRDGGYLVVKRSSYLPKVSVSDEEISKFYDANKERYRVPERVSVNYLELQLDDIAGKIAVSEDDLRQRYEAQKQNYRVPEQRKASHILITVPKGADAKADAAAKAKVENIRKQIEKGASFAAMAKKYSDDPGSAKQGGELGFFGHGVMDPAFEKATFALKVGQVSEPVRSSYGYHLIKLEAVKGGKVEPFDKVREQILKEVRRNRAEKKFYDMADKLANLTYEHPESLDLAAEKLGLTKRTSALFDRNHGTGIFSNDKVRNAAFSDDVLQNGNNSDVVEMTKEHLVVMHIKEHEPSTIQPLDKVKDRITATLKNQKAGEEAKKAAEADLAKIRAGANPEALAKSLKLTWKKLGGVERDAKGEDHSVLTTLFAMPHPNEPKVPTLKQIKTEQGDEAVVVLSAVHDGDPAKVAAAERKKTDKRMTTAQTEVEFDSVVDTLRARATITQAKKLK